MGSIVFQFTVEICSIPFFWMLFIVSESADGIEEFFLIEILIGVSLKLSFGFSDPQFRVEICFRLFFGMLLDCFFGLVLWMSLIFLDVLIDLGNWVWFLYSPLFLLLLLLYPILSP